ncbi:hypothetical protein BV455_03417 [Parageobacillus caldoxylosilyticus]|jgi:hypothetical protein|nr:hypothetical protein BV455_03417 [Parageobacillus caldoxylosilyticus]
MKVELSKFRVKEGKSKRVDEHIGTSVLMKIIQHHL